MVRLSHHPLTGYPIFHEGDQPSLQTDPVVVDYFRSFLCVRPCLFARSSPSCPHLLCTTSSRCSGVPTSLCCTPTTPFLILSPRRLSALRPQILTLTHSLTAHFHLRPAGAASCEPLLVIGGWACLSDDRRWSGNEHTLMRHGQAH